MELLFDHMERLGLLDHDLRPNPSFHWYPDQSASTLRITTNDGTVEHTVPHIDGNQTYEPAELALVQTFMDELADLESLVGRDEISHPVAYVPDQWLIVDGWSDYADSEGIRPWPLDADAEVGLCVVMPLDAPADTDTATGGYITIGGDVVYAFAALPWHRCDGTDPRNGLVS